MYTRLDNPARTFFHRTITCHRMSVWKHCDKYTSMSTRLRVRVYENMSTSTSAHSKLTFLQPHYNIGLPTSQWALTIYLAYNVFIFFVCATFNGMRWRDTETNTTTWQACKKLSIRSSFRPLELLRIIYRVIMQPRTVRHLFFLFTCSLLDSCIITR